MMSDFTPKNRIGSEPGRPRRIVPWVLLLLLAVAIVAVLWASNRIGSESSPFAAVHPNGEPSLAAEIADKTARDAVANLQQTIQELQAAQQRAAEQISGLQRQISVEQGQRKLLSEQLGGLSARVDSLQGSNAAAPLSPPPPAKKGRGQ
jgi:peptidoglycan hydrolase CwlO-like protein